MTLSKRLLGTGLLALVGMLGLVPLAHADQAPDGFETVVTDRLAIESVYASHRRGTDVDSRVASQAARRRVDDALRLTTALETLWGEKISAARLEAELKRMARETRDPRRLRALFAAAGRDGARAVEALARPALAERLAREAYAADGALHRETEAAAEGALEQLRQGEPWREVVRETGGRVVERVLLRARSEDDTSARGPAEPNERWLGPDEWDRQLDRLARLFKSAPERPLRAAHLPTGQWAPPREDPSRFWTVSVTKAGDDRLELTRLIWDKRPFDAWWEQARERFDPAEPLESAASIELPTPSGTAPSTEGPATDAPGGSWRGLFGSPAGRRAHVAVWTGAEMIVWGGFAGRGRILGDGARFDPATATWSSIARAGAPSARYEATAVWTGSEMIVWGGLGSEGEFLGDGGAYDPGTDSWRALEGTDAPAGRYDHTAVWTGSEMIVWGGRAFGSEPLSSGAAYDPGADAWTPTSEDGAAEARYRHAAAWIGSRMLVWGGRGAEDAVLDTGALYDPAADGWVPTAETGAPAPRDGHTAVWTGERVLIWGGQTGQGTRLADGSAYDPVGDAWSGLPADGAPAARVDHTAIWSEAEMIVWGGSGALGSRGDGGAYDPAANSWRPLAESASSPSARSEHTAVWAGSEMIVWGGGPGSGATLNTGGRYDPDADAWTPTPATAPVSQHTAVWTGSEMIVWGGTDGVAYTATGRRYDPATDTWTPVAVDDATPEARGLHTAVWTGSEMIVWGGYGLEAPVNTGGRYDPGADSWQSIDAEEAPPARFDHTAVWTGSEMIVWAGKAGVVLADGGRYDPGADSWTATAETELLGRRGHTAVWTGSEMIVWGGRGLADFDDGARYDPAEDAWTPITRSGAPSPRRDHVAAWTGTRMLVWGGYSDEDGTFPQGSSQYEPATDDWTLLPLAGDPPQGRSRAASTWTGRELVLWGGERLDPVDSGGRYNPFSEEWVPMEPAPEGLVGRVRHTAVWSDEGLIVWGGESGSPLNDGGIYTVVYTWFRDADGDGFGDPDETADGIVAPDGFVGSPDDCDDTDAAVFPGGREVNDGQDNQCPGERGFGVVDENTGESGFLDPEDKTVYSWDPQEGATDYAAARASNARFTTGCDGIDSTGGETQWVDPEEPDPGRAFYYLNRPIAPNLGSWGQDSALNERTGPCL